MDIFFFKSPAEFRAWLEANHDQQTELWVGFYKKASGKPSLTWSEAVDQALCFGWIDGIRKGVDETRYTIRFTHRKPRSIWSAVNINKVAELTQQGLMQPAGLRAFEERAPDKSVIYSYEQQGTLKLDAADEAIFRVNQTAWDFFNAQPPSYQKAAIWWVLSAKKAQTRQKRLTTLIDDSQHGRQVAQFRRRTGQS